MGRLALQLLVAASLLLHFAAARDFKYKIDFLHGLAVTSDSVGSYAFYDDQDETLNVLSDPSLNYFWWNKDLFTTGDALYSDAISDAVVTIGA